MAGQLARVCALAIAFVLSPGEAEDAAGLTPIKSVPKMPGNGSNCELPNGFRNERCGHGDNRVCCCPEEECITAELKDNDEVFACSKSRKLFGTKVIKIIMIPITFTLGSIGVIVYMVALSWLLVFSPMWTLGCYSVFLSLIVAYTCSWNGGVWWVYRLAWVLQIFHIIAFFGPFETFHVPLSAHSGLGTGPKKGMSAAIFETDAIAGESSCSQYYENYFTLQPIERQAEGNNPDKKVFGLCDQHWLACLQFILTLLGLHQMAICVISARCLVSRTTPDQAASGVVQPAAAQVTPAPPVPTAVPTTCETMPEPEALPPKEERRIANDGGAYTFADFAEFYGEKAAEEKWAAAPVAEPLMSPASAQEKLPVTLGRRLLALADMTTPPQPQVPAPLDPPPPLSVLAPPPRNGAA